MEEPFLWEIGTEVQVVEGEQTGTIAPIADQQIAVATEQREARPVYEVAGIWYLGEELVVHH